jgi:hypothetical protein
MVVFYPHLLQNFQLQTKVFGKPKTVTSYILETKKEGLNLPLSNLYVLPFRDLCFYPVLNVTFNPSN